MQSVQWVRDLTHEAPIIAPSLLAADFSRLGEEASNAEKAGAKVLHIDVMDGHFVPNISIGVPVVESLRKVTNLPLDVHLMITHPEDYIEPFIRAGASSILFHIEVQQKPRPLLDRIRAFGVAPGLVINPATPVEAILPYVDACDLILTMSVEPGFGGQSFIPEVLSKVRAIKEVARPDTLLSIDGGIGPTTIAEAAQAGANFFVVGTAFFGAPHYAERMTLLRQLAKEKI